MLHKKEVKLAAFMVLLMASASASAFAGTASAVTFKDSRAGKMAYKTGIPQLIKMPFKPFAKVGESMENAPSSSYLSSEDVVVGEPYNLDAETTG